MRAGPPACDQAGGSSVSTIWSTKLYRRCFVASGIAAIPLAASLPLHERRVFRRLAEIALPETGELRTAVATGALVSGIAFDGADAGPRPSAFLALTVYV